MQAAITTRGITVIKINRSLIIVNINFLKFLESENKDFWIVVLQIYEETYLLQYKFYFCGKCIGYMMLENIQSKDKDGCLKC